MSGKTDDPGDKDPQEAKVQKRRLSWVWLIPIASVAIGGWLLWKTLSDRGPLIDVTFNTAEGLQAGQSPVKFKDIQMGTVESFDLSPGRKVTMHLRMTDKAKPLLTQGAAFWVVKPRVFAGEITGLNTVLSGSYVNMRPGGEGKPAQDTFTGLEQPPLDSDEPGRRFSLVAPRLGALSLGSPVFFHDVEVGKVLGWKLSDAAERVTLDVFVDAPYDKWVHDDSMFWNTSGIAVKLETDGVKLQVDSFKAAVLGGITFDTPSGRNEPASAEGRQFALYPDEAVARSKTARHQATLVTYLDGSVDGLSQGAPVDLLGIRVGSVNVVDLQFNNDTDRSRVRVEFTIDIDRATEVGSKPDPPSLERWRLAVEKGLRTRLQGGNILTGQKLLAMEIEPDAPPAQMGIEGGMPVIPWDGAGGGGLEGLSRTAGQLLANLKSVPFKQIGQSLKAAVGAVDSLVSSPQTKQALMRLNSTLAAAESTIKNVDAGTKPALKRLPAIAAEQQATLSQVKALTGSVSAGSSGDSKTGRDLDRVLIQAAEAAQSVRMLADLLSRHPEALIRGRSARATE